MTKYDIRTQNETIKDPGDFQVSSVQVFLVLGSKLKPITEVTRLVHPLQCRVLPVLLFIAARRRSLSHIHRAGKGCKRCPWSAQTFLSWIEDIFMVRKQECHWGLYWRLVIESWWLFIFRVRIIYYQNDLLCMMLDVYCMLCTMHSFAQWFCIFVNYM